ncbi:ATP-dependent DNA helicase [Aphis craccivora]|uniref:ATP-dependent DNA helicase n=1 Tax=Aphis craccivora TaxID=307492 RepID=A0A6G0YMN2_APHCR|nr:ATP-dependent DNA helicase [Aphis craccivora]
MCRLNGKIKLEVIFPPPEPLNSLLICDHPKHGKFKRNIRRYNNAFQMTSFKTLKFVKYLKVILCQFLKSKARYIIWLVVYYRIDLANTNF